MDKKVNMRDCILNTVEKLIETQGVNDFSLRDISQSLGISLGSLYYYFKTKDSIIMAIIERQMELLDSEYTKWLIRHKDKKDLTKDRFINIIIYKGIELFNSYKMHIYLTNESMKGNTAIRDRYNKLLESWQEKIVEGVKQVYGEREDAEAVGYLLMVIMQGLTVRSALDNRNYDEEKLIKSILKKI